MSRAIRSKLLYPGCYAHIISRSIRKEYIFKETEDFQKFISLLKEAKEQREFDLYHYCLMQTHFHLVVRLPSPQEFSKAMYYLKNRYVIYYHTKYKLSGPIWRERYKSLLIEDELYLYACGQYVECNPVNAGLVGKAGDWEFSSARHYQTKEQNPLIDDYKKPQDGTITLYTNTAAFEAGQGIGSDYFKFKLRRNLR